MTATRELPPKSDGGINEDERRNESVRRIIKSIRKYAAEKPVLTTATGVRYVSISSQTGAEGINQGERLVVLWKKKVQGLGISTFLIPTNDGKSNLGIQAGIALLELSGSPLITRQLGNKEIEDFKRGLEGPIRKSYLIEKLARPTADERRRVSEILGPRRIMRRS